VQLAQKAKMEFWEQPARMDLLVKPAKPAQLV
jgi:hypothetical protein